MDASCLAISLHHSLGGRPLQLVPLAARNSTEALAVAAAAGHRLHRVLGGFAGHFPIDAMYAAYFTRAAEVTIVATYVAVADPATAQRVGEAARGAVVEACGGRLADVTLLAVGKLHGALQLSMRRAAAGFGRVPGIATAKFDIATVTVGAEAPPEDAATMAVRAGNDVAAPHHAAVMDAQVAAQGKGNQLVDNVRAVRVPRLPAHDRAALATLPVTVAGGAVAAGGDAEAAAAASGVVHLAIGVRLAEDVSAGASSRAAGSGFAHACRGAPTGASVMPSIALLLAAAGGTGAGAATSVTVVPPALAAAAAGTRLVSGATGGSSRTLPTVRPPSDNGRPWAPADDEGSDDEAGVVLQPSEEAPADALTGLGSGDDGGAGVFNFDAAAVSRSAAAAGSGGGAGGLGGSLARGTSPGGGLAGVVAGATGSVGVSSAARSPRQPPSRLPGLAEETGSVIAGASGPGSDAGDAVSARRGQVDGSLSARSLGGGGGGVDGGKGEKSSGDAMFDLVFGGGGTGSATAPGPTPSLAPAPAPSSGFGGIGDPDMAAIFGGGTAATPAPAPAGRTARPSGTVTAVGTAASAVSPAPASAQAAGSDFDAIFAISAGPAPTPAPAPPPRHRHDVSIKFALVINEAITSVTTVAPATGAATAPEAVTVEGTVVIKAMYAAPLPPDVAASGHGALRFGLPLHFAGPLASLAVAPAGGAAPADTAAPATVAVTLPPPTPGTPRPTHHVTVPLAFPPRPPHATGNTPVDIATLTYRYDPAVVRPSLLKLLATGKPTFVGPAAGSDGVSPPRAHRYTDVSVKAVLNPLVVHDAMSGAQILVAMPPPPAPAPPHLLGAPDAPPAYVAEPAPLFRPAGAWSGPAKAQLLWSLLSRDVPLPAGMAEEAAPRAPTYLPTPGTTPAGELRARVPVAHGVALAGDGGEPGSHAVPVQARFQLVGAAAIVGIAADLPPPGSAAAAAAAAATAVIADATAGADIQLHLASAQLGKGTTSYRGMWRPASA